MGVSDYSLFFQAILASMSIDGAQFQYVNIVLAGLSYDP